MNARDGRAASLKAAKKERESCARTGVRNFENVFIDHRIFDAAYIVLGKYVPAEVVK